MGTWAKGQVQVRSRLISHKFLNATAYQQHGEKKKPVLLSCKLTTTTTKSCKIQVYILLIMVLAACHISVVLKAEWILEKMKSWDLLTDSIKQIFQWENERAENKPRRGKPKGNKDGHGSWTVARETFSCPQGWGQSPPGSNVCSTPRSLSINRFSVEWKKLCAVLCIIIS